MSEIQDFYFLGFYSKVVSEYSKDRSPDAQFMVLRSRLALGQIELVKKEVSDVNASPVYPGINLLANVIQKEKKDREEFITNSVDPQLKIANQYYSACLAVAYLLAEKPGNALETIGDSNFFEAGTIKIQCFLAFNRVDLAENVLANIGNVIQKNIAAALIALHKDQDSIRNALNNLLDIQERYQDSLKMGISPLLGSLIASSHFAVGENESGTAVIMQLQENFFSDPNVSINQYATQFPAADLKTIKLGVDLLVTQKNEYADKINDMIKEFDEAAAEISSA